MIRRYAAALGRVANRPYFLHAIKNSDALTVRLIVPAERDRSGFVAADLSGHLPAEFVEHRDERAFDGVVIGKEPGSAWCVETAVTFRVSLLGGLRPYCSWVLGVDGNGRFVTPFERFEATRATKLPRGRLMRLLGIRQIGFVASRFGADTLDECSIMLGEGEHGHYANFDFDFRLEEVVGTDITMTQTPDFYPRAKIDGPATVAAGQVGTFTVRFVDKSTGETLSNGTKPVKVTLEATSGVVVDSTVYPVNGVAAFRWMALGMGKGEIARIKSAWGSWTGDDEIEVAVA